ncbi:MAG TPA: ATP-binding protein [Gammaproteobacteria bacterium]|nr:ATP-binding protein [Gammaproteobacteria bacterium]
MIRNWGIRSRVLLLALVPVICLGILLGTYLTRVRVHDLQASEHLLGNTLANQLASASEYGVYSNNMMILETLAHTVAQEPGVEAITIANRNNNTLVHVTRPAIESHSFISNLSRRIGAETGLQNTLTFTRSILLRSVVATTPGTSYPNAVRNNFTTNNKYQVIGKVTVKLSETHFVERQTEIIVNGGMIILSCLIFSLFLALVIGGSVAVPITRVIEMVSRFSSGDHSARVSERSGGEIGQLESGINLMATNAERSQQELQSQVNQATTELRETMEEMEVKNVELDLARKRALEASKVKSDFLSNMSHEIRTPMNAIMGFASLLAKTRLNKDQRYYLDTVQHSAATLLTLIDDVLSLQRLEATRPLLQTAFSLREILEESIKLLAHEAYKKELELILYLPAGLPINYMGDSVKISRVIINLLSNAVKFTEYGYIKVSVNVLERHAHTVTLCISIRDTGIGIHREHIKDLFKPFTMFNTTTDHQHSGTGLGLAISQQLMDTLGGTLSVSSHLGEGSEFRAELTLPLLETTQHTQPINPNEEALLYESQPEMAVALQARLEGLGLHLSVCHTPEQLSMQLQSAIEIPYRLVVLSISYEEILNHKDVCLILNQYHNLSILILINSLESSTQKRISEAIGGVCLPKCVDTSMLDKKIRQLLPRRTSAPVTKRGITRYTSQPLSEFRILVVEDNRINRELIILQLQNLGADVKYAEDGYIALTRFSEQRPDAIVLDMRLGQESGLDIADKITRLAGDHKVPILMLSATREQASIEESRSLGICGWLLKPVDELVLANALLAVLPSASPKQQVKNNPLKQLNTELAQLRPEILNMLRQDLPMQQRAIFSAWEKHDFSALRDSLHILHGTAALCKLTNLNTYCSNMENLLSKKSSTKGNSQLMTLLKDEIDRVITLLDVGGHDSRGYAYNDSLSGIH